MGNQKIFRLECALSEIMEKYPDLTTQQGQEIIDSLYRGKEALICEVWNVIDCFVTGIILEHKRSITNEQI